MILPPDVALELTPRRLAVPLGGVNPLQAWLDEREFPWRDSLGQLIDRFGMKTHPAYQWDMVAVPCPLPLQGLIFPLAAQAFSNNNRHVPPDRFSAEIWLNDDPLTNLRYVADIISPLLGPAPLGCMASNAIGCRWQAGPASLSLTSFPPAMQSFYAGNNPSHERDPRLKTACHLSLEPGYRQPLSPQERGWLDSFVDIMPVTGKAVHDLLALRDASPGAGAAPFVREPVAACAPLLGRIGQSADGEGLIVCAGNLLLIPLRRVIGVRVMKLTKAKGPGGSWLNLTYHADDLGQEAPSLWLCAGSGPDDMDDLAIHLGQAIGKPVEIEPAYADC